MGRTPRFPDGKEAPKGTISTAESIIVPALHATETSMKLGRPRKLKMPPLPVELYDAMTELERDHFDFFVQTIREENPDLTPSDLIYLNQAGLEYINTLRLQVAQLQSGQLVTMSRQHPSVQLRSWIDLLSVSRKQRGPGKTEEEKQREKWRKQFEELAE